ncbi:MAG: hypothetical protein H6835_03215 [Planctomycetes bacterium]|nr:hypothetical protein [Planctomycetota bacterium]
MSSSRLAVPRLAASLLPFALCLPLAAQMTYLVGPNGMPNLSTALFVAVDGDRIHVEPGSYPAFECTVGVTIRALQPGTVTIGAGAMTNFLLTPAQTVHLSGVDFDGRVQANGGRVAMVDCSVTGPFYALFAQNGDLDLIGCTIQMTSGALFHNAALRVDNEFVTAIDCTFAGGSAPASGFGDGIAAFDSQLHLSNVTAAGEGSLSSGIGGAVNVMSNSIAWLSDSTASSVFSCPIRAALGGVVYVDGVTTNGVGGFDCGTTTPKSLLAVSQPGPLLAGAPFQLDYRGEANGVLAVFAAPTLATHLVPGLLDQPSSLDPGSAFLAGLALLDGTGHATMTWNIPGGPAIPDLTLWFKGISGLSFPLQVSPVAGGVAR